MIRVLARNANSPTNFTNGSQGLHDIGHPPIPFSLIGLTEGLARDLGFQVQNVGPVVTNMLFYLIGIAILGLVIMVAARLNESAIGRAWTAIREDEVAAIAMGVPLVRMKLLAFASGASFAGAMGVLYGAKQTFIDPDSFELLQSITILAMVIVGGMGSIRGVLLGATVITLLNQHALQSLSNQISALRNVDYMIPIIHFNMSDWPIDLDPAKYQRLLFGLILVSMMLFRPAGLLPEQRRRLELQGHKEPLDIDTEGPSGTTATGTTHAAPAGD
jgi:branched-chain amino acid transport system permease protein